MCGVELRDCSQPGRYPSGWDTCDEARWRDDGEDADGDVWLAYRAAGGSREFDAWRAEPCRTCSQRHNWAEHAHRPLEDVLPWPELVRRDGAREVIDLQLYSPAPRSASTRC